MSDFRASILIVDDQPDNLRALSLILQQAGYRVRKATNGEMALESAIAQTPDLILLDILMPLMNGFEVCSQLKADPRTSSVPVIFLSALDYVEEKLKAFEVGGVDYVTKPFHAKEVLARVEYQLTIQLQQRQLVEQNQQLQQQIRERRLLGMIVSQIRGSLDLDAILNTTVEEVRSLLQLDRVLINRFRSDGSGQILAESVQDMSCSRLGQVVVEPGFCEYWQEEAPRRRVNVIANVETSNLAPNYLDFLRTLQIQAGLVVPIFQDGKPWGLLAAHDCTAPRTWKQWEINIFEQLSEQLEIAIQQAELFHQVQHLNTNLEQEVQHRTLELQQAVQELQRMNRLKDDFLNTISHELRTPIANIRMVLRLLNQTLQEPSSFTTEKTIAEYLRVLQDECEQEMGLIQDLLDLQHLEAEAYPLSLSQVNLLAWLPHLLETFESRIQQQQQTLHVDLDPHLPPLTTDLSSLNHILTELLENACKYTPNQETIRLSAHLQTSPPDSTQPLELNSDDSIAHHAWLCISISSSGVEIAPEELPRLFDKFYRVPSDDPWKHSGTGLGLALVKKLSERLGGSVAVESGDRLTCFTVTLPVGLSVEASSSVV